jgi:pyrroloquinoline quinone biosynthesis protein A
MYRLRQRVAKPQMITLFSPEKTMWTKPEFTEMRFGFEVTMYIYNR